MGNPAGADDLVQETLKRALIHIGKGRQVRNLRSYLLTILHNVRMDQIRKEKNHGQQVPLDEAMTVAEPAAQPHRLEYNRLLAALSELSEDQRAVLLLAGLEGRKYREVAEILGQPIGTVMSRLNRGRAALRRRLDDEAPAQAAETAYGKRDKPVRRRHAR
ncbi:RNA polymerase subunit sigma-24 [Minwuia thermotolerans]|uniref:RNA polymerase sigma factor n=2 Tax=Minwuia thermotolerans TaxID=2056226 RepID=A0A2M9FY11_9PROT|nr:RNA polymerase subunit sigma-24 [Minwuia thermotolerans]